MYWFHLEAGIRTNSKIRKLAKSFDVDLPRAVGWMVCLWAWVCQHRPDGSLDDLDADDIAFAALFDGDPGEFTATLVRLRLLDQTDHGLIVHEWMNRAEGFRRARKEQERRALKRSRSSVDAQENDAACTTRAPRVHHARDTNNTSVHTRAARMHDDDDTRAPDLRGLEKRIEEKRSEEEECEEEPKPSSPQAAAPADGLAEFEDEPTVVNLTRGEPCRPPTPRPPDTMLEFRCRITPSSSEPVYFLTESWVRSMRSLYPGVNIDLEVRRIHTYFHEQRPEKYKTYSGWPKAIMGWLGREQKRIEARAQRTQAPEANTGRGINKWL